MKHALFCLLSGLMLLACSSKPTLIAQDSMTTAGNSPETVAWNFAPNAIALHITATADLNLIDDQAHTLSLCLYQLANPAPFRERTVSVGGVVSLLDCERFDPSVKAADRIIVTPGMVARKVFDRVEGAKYVAIAAGYATLHPDQITRVWSIPLAHQQTGSLWWKDDVFTPGKIDLVVQLGSGSLENIVPPQGAQGTKK